MRTEELNFVPNEDPRSDSSSSADRDMNANDLATPTEDREASLVDRDSTPPERDTPLAERNRRAPSDNEFSVNSGHSAKGSAKRNSEDSAKAWTNRDSTASELARSVSGDSASARLLAKYRHRHYRQNLRRDADEISTHRRSVAGNSIGEESGFVYGADLDTDPDLGREMAAPSIAGQSVARYSQVCAYSNPNNELLFKHRKRRILLILLNFFLQWGFILFFAFFNFPSWTETASDDGSGGLFRSSFANLTQHFVVDLTIESSTFFWLWLGVSVAQLFWITYSICSIVRRGSKGFLYLDPEFVPAKTHGCYAVCVVFCVAWLLLWDAGLMGMALIPLLLSVTSIVNACHHLLKDYHDSLPFFAKEFPTDLIIVPVMVVAPLGAGAAWMIYNAFYYSAVVLTHVDGVSRVVSGGVAFGGVGVVVVAWLALDLTFMETYTRHLLAPYLFLGGVLLATLATNDGVAMRNKVIVGATLVLLATLLCFRVVCCCRRMKRSRKYSLSHEKMTFL